MARASGERFDLGRVFSGTVAAISSNWIPILAVTVAAGIASSVANAVLMRDLVSAMDPTNAAASPAIFLSVSYYVAIFAGLIATAFAQASILALLFARQNGAPAGARPAIMGGLRFAVPLIGLTILWWIGVSVGFILLVVPGVILLVIWSVTMPVLVGEQSGVIAAFGRSRALTKGIRWPIFGTLLLFGAGIIFLSFASQGFSSTGMLQLYQSNIVLASILGVVMFAVQTALLTGFLFALYNEVVLVNDGRSEGGLAEIFA